MPRTTLSILPAKSGEVWIGAHRGGLSRLEVPVVCHVSAKAADGDGTQTATSST